jgi:hypothetical protein
MMVVVDREEERLADEIALLTRKERDRFLGRIVVSNEVLLSYIFRK